MAHKGIKLFLILGWQTSQGQGEYKEEGTDQRVTFC
jgi:hypothetical protein